MDRKTSKLYVNRRKDYEVITNLALLLTFPFIPVINNRWSFEMTFKLVQQHERLFGDPWYDWTRV